MTWLVVIGGLIALVAILFLVLNSLGEGSYRPTKEQIKKIIESTIDDSIDHETFDEFYCVKIDYDFNLENIRERYSTIVSDPEYVDGKQSNESIVPLSAEGKRELSKLIENLDASAR